MDILRRLFSRYTGLLRSFKFVYFINNLFNKDKLSHNEALYKKYGLKKSIFSSVSSNDFKNPEKELPWLDRPDALENVSSNPSFIAFSPEIQNKIITFINEGYVVLENFYSVQDVDSLNHDIDQLLEQKKADFNYTGKKIMEANKISEIADKKFFRNPELLKLLDFIMGKKVIPFHTINFIEGSEQRAHSDFIHMTTEPKGYLIAAWTALEPCSDENGPLFYYPKSHRLPYILSDDYNTGNTRWTIGNNNYKNYEDRIESLIQEHQLEKRVFHANTGDVFIWHANLLHGGSPISKAGTTRKSMVAHYFCEDVICYHEISQRPALMEIH